MLADTIRAHNKSNKVTPLEKLIACGSRAILFHSLFAKEYLQALAVHYGVPLRVLSRDQTMWPGMKFGVKSKERCVLVVHGLIVRREILESAVAVIAYISEVRIDLMVYRVLFDAFPEDYVFSCAEISAINFACAIQHPVDVRYRVIFIKDVPRLWEPGETPVNRMIKHCLKDWVKIKYELSVKTVICAVNTQTLSWMAESLPLDSYCWCEVGDKQYKSIKEFNRSTHTFLLLSLNSALRSRNRASINAGVICVLDQTKPCRRIQSAEAMLSHTEISVEFITLGT